MPFLEWLSGWLLFIVYLFAFSRIVRDTWRWLVDADPLPDTLLAKLGAAWTQTIFLVDLIRTFAEQDAGSAVIAGWLQWFPELTFGWIISGVIGGALAIVLRARAKRMQRRAATTAS